MTAFTPGSPLQPTTNTNLCSLNDPVVGGSAGGVHPGIEWIAYKVNAYVDSYVDLLTRAFLKGYLLPLAGSRVEFGRDLSWLVMVQQMYGL